MADYIVRATAANAQIRAFACTARDMVETARAAHNSSPVITAAMGRLMIAGAMMGSMLKGDDLLTLQIKGDGPVKGITVTADANGHVKGYPIVPDVILPANSMGKLDVAGAVGAGTLTVIKDMGLKEPYSGQIPLVSGEIAEDITQYLAVSEQTPGACALGVLIDTDLTVKCAGGFLLQILPFTPDETIDRIEQNLKNITSVTALLEKGMTAEELAKLPLEGLEPDVLDDFEVNYVCDCSRERTERMLISLGRDDLEELARDEVTEVNCNFCDKKYRFTSDEIRALIKESENTNE